MDTDDFISILSSEKIVSTEFLQGAMFYFSLMANIHDFLLHANKEKTAYNFENFT